MNFGTDTSQIKELASDLKKNAGEIETVIAGIFSKLEGLNGNGWQGTAYDTFLKQCNSYKTALNKLPEVINDFAKFFETKVHSNAEELQAEVRSSFNDIEQV